MKILTLLAVLISCMGYSQFFESENSYEEVEETHNQAFQSSDTFPDEPDQGLDAIGNPGDPVPIDKGILLLPVLGIAVGLYYLHQHRKLNDSPK